MESIKPAKVGGLLKKKEIVVEEEERDYEGQMNGGEGVDIIPNIEDETTDGKISKLKGPINMIIALSSKDITLGKKLISRFNSAIEEASSQGDLAETSSKVFEFTLKLANSIQSASVLKQIPSIATAILTKIRELSAFAEDSHVEGVKLLAQTLHTMESHFSSVESATSESTLKLSTTASLALITLIESFLNQKFFKVTYSHGLARVLVALSQFLVDKIDIFIKKAEDIFAHLSKLEGFNVASFLENVIDPITKPIKYTYLAIATQDKAVLIKIAQKYGELVMNDKEKSNHLNLPFFVQFLRRIDLDTFKDKVLSEIEFMMNRNCSLVPLIGGSIAHLSFPFTPELVHSITSAIFNDDYMVKDEAAINAREYFGILASKLTTPETVKALVIDFLFKKFIETRNSSLTAAQRLTFIRHISFVYQSLTKKDLIDLDQVKQVISAALEYYFNQKEEV